jgi:hypothetical protein
MVTPGQYSNHLNRFSFFTSLLFCSLFLSAQDSICIKGFVKDKYDVLSDFPITVKHKDISTHSSIRGKFKICCSQGDTLVFYDKKTRYAEETYIVRDNAFVIIELSHPTEITNGRRSIYGRITKISSKHSIIISGAVNNITHYAVGYEYTLPPLFIERIYIPFYNTFSAGINLADQGNELLLFPYIGIPIKGAYHNSDFSLSLFTPHIKLGYYFNVSDSKPVHGFGYDLSIDVLYFRADFMRRKSLGITLGYNNYIDPDGAFMLSAKMNFSSGKNKLPRIIQNINRK